MSKRISRRVREEAARACSALACNRASADVEQVGLHSIVQGNAYALAMLAIHAVTLLNPRLDDNAGWAVVFAEAESLLRCGWSPS